MYKHLRVIRIVISAAILVIATWAIIDTAFGVTSIGRIVAEAQLVNAILAGTVGWILLWVVVTLVFGRVYCSSICPLGTLQDGCAHIGMKLRRPLTRHYTYHPPLNALRIPIAVVVAICLIAGITTVVVVTDPYVVYSKIVTAIARPLSISLGSLAIAIAILVILAVVSGRRGRLICNTVCPVGGLLALLSRQPVYRVDINTDLCVHCGRCADVCKSECINAQESTVDTSRCVMCMNCTAGCPNNAITVRRGRHRLRTPMLMRT